MKRLIRTSAVILTAILLVIGCTHQIIGRATTPPRADQSTLFSDAVPVYGQNVSSDDTAKLAYLRALRRIDVCGLLTRDVLGRIGEIEGMGTLFALNECDVGMKESGVSGLQLLTAELTLAYPGSESTVDPCEKIVPLALNALPGAMLLSGPQQPVAKVSAIGQSSCDIVARVAGALTRRLSTAPLPMRDALASYPVALAERDPCEVLGVLGGQVHSWDIGDGGPYGCRFSVWQPASNDAFTVQVKLQPQLVGTATDDRQRRVRNGVEIYVDTSYCSALSFVGSRMLRKMSGGGYTEIPGTEIRPAVVVDGTGGGDCEAVVDIAARTAKLYA